MYALRERRQYVGQEDFVSDVLPMSVRSVDLLLRLQEMAVAKVLKKNAEGNTSVNKLFN
jgi:26S proteasome regulatory subunit T6